MPVEFLSDEQAAGFARQRLIAGKQLYHLLAETPGSGDLLGAG
ncbi:hypothetical protein [Nonomuraea guangzhouensis]|uniref:Uncharacterized protein n=1 Tax=Nonomuraea guangzhouensis TaxID=1291555 RepID=A0ABW4GXT8_9ACTN|nr:hypothetical protein [Nonomuraea guangzhouensis]